MYGAVVGELVHEVLGRFAVDSYTRFVVVGRRCMTLLFARARAGVRYRHCSLGSLGRSFRVVTINTIVYGMVFSKRG
jgi:hypothetical protein